MVPLSSTDYFHSEFLEVNGSMCVCVCVYYTFSSVLNFWNLHGSSKHLLILYETTIENQFLILWISTIKWDLISNKHRHYTLMSLLFEFLLSAFIFNERCCFSQNKLQTYNSDSCTFINLKDSPTVPSRTKKKIFMVAHWVRTRQ